MTWLPMSHMSAIAKELFSVRAKVKELEHELRLELAALPTAMGFDSVTDFVEAVRAATGLTTTKKRAIHSRRRRQSPGTRPKPHQTGSRRAKSKTVKRTHPIAPSAATDQDTIILIRDLVAAKKSDAEIATISGIELSEVAAVKAAAGV